MGLKTTLKNPLLMAVNLMILLVSVVSAVACKRIRIPSVMVATLLILSAISAHVVLSVLSAMATSDPVGGHVVHMIAINKYEPVNLTVTQGTKVKFLNEDISPHTVTQRDIGYSSTTSSPSKNNTGFDTGIINPGQTSEKTFNMLGEFRYFCQIHPWMQGTIKVI